MLTLLKHNNGFAAVYTVKFQKRGLPHAHLILLLEPEDKLITAAHIDKYISAEIPDKDKDPELYQIVTDQMIHGPCGAERPSCPCTVNNKCTKKFPKQFNETTFIDESGYTIYKKEMTVVLSKNNEQICIAIMVTVATENEEVDEISNYYNCRYLSTCEAAWRIYGFDIHYRFPPVERLPFHLPNEQSVIFDERDSLDYTLDKASKNDREANVEFPNDMLIPDSDDHIGSIIHESYPDLLQNQYDPDYFQERAILAPNHELVDMINDRMLSLIPGDKKTYNSSDTIGVADDDNNFDETMYIEEFLNNLSMAGVLNHSIKLKIGTPVMYM
uniref:DNA helicase Pif1-like 2B domain-containing protein n=1 Tax=Tanacetum cinerariifolium TaxID=118510 RepID=A0A699JHB2_TANCI|nr:hypothetical protein [Tanacetum cinerariifolium]